MKLKPAKKTLYNGMIKINLSKIKPMIALPFHPSNVFELDTVLDNPGDVFRQIEKDALEIFDKPVDLGLLKKIDKKNRIHVDQGIIAGCAGGIFDCIMAAAEILDGKAADQALNQGKGNFSLAIYPGSQPLYLEIARNGALAKLVAAGALVKNAYCGPCFGAGDIPANQGFSIRHCTRNFPNREGAKPNQGQCASVALMDSLSIAATAFNGGILSSAEKLPEKRSFKPESRQRYFFDNAPYKARVYNGIGRPEKQTELYCGPGIVDWPEMDPLGENLLIKIVSFIEDPITTTDELIPSGEISSFRSNPLALAEFTLSRKDPAYVSRAKAVRDKSDQTELTAIISACLDLLKMPPIQIASAIYAVKPGDGSAREQAASCQRILGGAANFAKEYATRRYRNNLINWGIIPFIIPGDPPFQNDDYLFIPEIKTLLNGCKKDAGVYVFRIMGQFAKMTGSFILSAPELNSIEKELLLAGSLINYNRNKINNSKKKPENLNE